MTTPLTGTTVNGVPYLAVPPLSDAATAPVIILWHLMDAPRSEAAFAAALPLDGLDAWKVYLGLPTFGARKCVVVVLVRLLFDELNEVAARDVRLVTICPAVARPVPSDHSRPYHPQTCGKVEKGRLAAASRGRTQSG
jgi:hypothetical protein